MEDASSELFHFPFDFQGVLFASNHTDEEIIGIADVLEPTVIWVEGLKIGDGLAFQFHPAKFLDNAFLLLRVLGFPQFFAEPGSIPGVVIGQKCGLSLFAPVKPCFELFHIPIQLIQVDVGKDGANNAPLGRSAVGVVERPIFQITRSQEFPYQAEEFLVVDAFRQNFHHGVVVDIVEEAFDVSLYKPLHPGKAGLNLV